jgi:hypothetical protein
VKLKLTELDPHFLKWVSPNNYDYTDDIAEAAGLEIRCPACHWADERTGSHSSHTLVLWADPKRWSFVGHGYRNLSLMAGRIAMDLTAGGCRCQFHIKGGKVDFY